MKQRNTWPRQPFLGLSIATGAGILVADLAPSTSTAVIVALAILAVVALLSQKSLVVYGFVATGFFLMHGERTSSSAGLRLAHELGEEPRPVTAIGSVVSEPKFSPNGSASFLFQLDSSEIDGVSRTCRAKFLARWHHVVEFGDQLKLFGTAEHVGPPRNPGEFDMRSYLARLDVHRELIVRYPENGSVLSHAGGNPILRMAQKSRGWLQRVLWRELEYWPEVTGAVCGMVSSL